MNYILLAIFLTNITILAYFLYKYFSLKNSDDNEYYEKIERLKHSLQKLTEYSNNSHTKTDKSIEKINSILEEFHIIHEIVEKRLNTIEHQLSSRKRKVSHDKK